MVYGLGFAFEDHASTQPSVEAVSAMCARILPYAGFSLVHMRG